MLLPQKDLYTQFAYNSAYLYLCKHIFDFRRVFLKKLPVGRVPKLQEIENDVKFQRKFQAKFHKVSESFTKFPTVFRTQ